MHNSLFSIALNSLGYSNICQWPMFEMNLQRECPITIKGVDEFCTCEMTQESSTS